MESTAIAILLSCLLASLSHADITMGVSKQDPLDSNYIEFTAVLGACSLFHPLCFDVLCLPTSELH